MSLLRAFAIILTLPALCFAQLIDSDVMPFGGYSSHPVYTDVFFSDSCLQVMHQELGINQFMGGGFSAYHAGRFVAESIYVYPWGTWPVVRPQQKYSHTTYFLCEAEDNYSDFKFETRNGTVQDSFLVYSGSDYMLDGLYYREENRVWMLGSFQKEFYPYLKMAVDTAGTDSSTLVGIFYVINMEDSTADSVRFVDSVFVRDLPADHDTLLSLTNDWEASGTYSDDFYFVMDDEESEDAPKIKFRFKASGNCTVYVDYFKVHCQTGDDLFGGDPEVARNIKAYVGRKADFDGKVLGWYLKDEPRPGNYRPYGCIDSLIQVAMVESSWTEPVRGVALFYQGMGGQPYKGLNDFIRLGHPNRVWLDPYCFYGGFGGWRTTKYSGYFHQGPPHERGLQFELNESLVRQCDSLMAALARSGMEDSLWMFTPQYFAGRDSTSQEDTTWIWRFPTRAEMICETFMGLCYRPMGIMFWKYDQNWNYSNNSGSRGLVNDDGTHHYMYNVVMNDINPYLKAIDSTFLSVTWKGTYVVSDSSDLEFDPPDTAFVDTIYAISNTSDPNPDLGWFQVGEFTAGSDKYILLVNRACSQGKNDPTAAPSVTATVKFNTTNLGLGDYVYIIDLADSLRLAGADTGWVGIPDTTYSANLGGTIPFTTVLGPGEGRLFKIVQTTCKTLSGDIHTQYKYQGKISVSGDITIPANETMEIFGPARFEIIRCDDQDGGTDTSLVELIINGKLYAIGTPNDSIIFYPDTLYNCDIELLSNPQAGDWYGIRDRCDEKDTLAFCAIRYAYNGYSGEATSNAIIRHCRISNSENSGIRLVNACRDTLNVDSCLISDNGSHGIEATISCLIADGNTITKNTSSGVYIVENGTIPCGDLDYRLANNTITQGDDYSTQKGVNVSGTAANQPAVVFENNLITGFSTAGVYLYRVADGDWSGYGSGTRFSGYNEIDSNDTYGLWCNHSSPAMWSSTGDCDGYNSVSRNDDYGIYCTNSSSPQIKQATLALNRLSNFYNLDPCNPCLGDTSAGGFDGENVFVTADRGFDFKTTALAQYIVKAHNNYWGEYNPDTLDFYPSKLYIEYKPYLQINPCGDPRGKIVDLGQVIPEKFALYQNYPNPFNPTTSISFDLPEASYAKISIYNILGQRVRILTDEYYEPGHHVIVWDSRDRYGNEVASGIYFYLLEASQFADVRKMLILR